VQNLIDRYIVEHLPTKTAGKQNPKLAAQRLNDEKKMLAEIGERLGRHTKLTDVHGGDIKKMHRDIGASIGRRTGRPRLVRANRILSIASKMFSLSLQPLPGENTPWRDQAQGNPCKGVKHNHEEGRERFYSTAELERIADALAAYRGLGADCVRLAMFTGCRPDEAKGARWEEFDKEPETWCKPSAHTKQRKIHRLPLNAPALQLIEKLRAERKGPWLFPGQDGDQPLAVIRHVWDFVREHAGLAKDEKGNAARVYDLRHTFASVGAGGGLSLPIIGRLLGHTSPRTTQNMRTLRTIHCAMPRTRSAP
jgi:integrase